MDFESQLVRVARRPASETTEAWTPKDKDMRLVPMPAEAVNMLIELHLAAGEAQAYVIVNGKGPAVGERVIPSLNRRSGSSFTSGPTSRYRATTSTSATPSSVWAVILRHG